MKQRKRMNRLNKGKKKKMDSRWIKTNNIYLQMVKMCKTCGKIPS